MNILVDNYDSFSYNLYQLLGQIDEAIQVVRNDELTVAALLALHPAHIIISPGPGRPAEAGICEDLIRQAGTVPLLGVCLGHQALCEAYGGVITYAKELMHGKQSDISLHGGSPLFRELPDWITVGRYHSLAVDAGSLPEELEVLAETGDGEIMAVGHKQYPQYGVQFHPESILTPLGPQIIRNFLNL